jgi:hypothetical protein
MWLGWAVAATDSEICQCWPVTKLDEPLKSDTANCFFKLHIIIISTHPHHHHHHHHHLRCLIDDAAYDLDKMCESARASGARFRKKITGAHQ